jgi:ABC-type phosphonate transport system ATPase subunit
VTYADDSNVWALSDTLEELKTKLEDLAARFAAWASGNGLVINGSKTQLLVSHNGGKNLDGFTVDVCGKAVVASDGFELLGVKFDRRLTTAPHDAMVAAATRQWASLVARLRHHLPRGRYLRQLAAGLVRGKVNHALPAVAHPRLAKADGPTNTCYKTIQVAINDVARSVTGKRRSEHITIEALLDAAKLQNVNSMVTAAVAVEAWKAHKSCDGNNGGRNPIGNAIFDSSEAEHGRTSRATAAGQVHVPLQGCRTMVTAAAKIWNSSPALRAARSLGEARSAAKSIAKGVPL